MFQINYLSSLVPVFLHLGLVWITSLLTPLGNGQASSRSGIIETLRDLSFRRWAALLQEVWVSSNFTHTRPPKLSSRGSLWLRDAEAVLHGPVQQAHRKFALLVRSLPWQPLKCRGVHLFIFYNYSIIYIEVSLRGWSIFGEEPEKLFLR